MSERVRHDGMRGRLGCVNECGVRHLIGQLTSASRPGRGAAVAVATESIYGCGVSVAPLADAAYLARYSGVRPASAVELAELDGRADARERADRDASLSFGQAGVLLECDIDGVHALVSGGHLSAYPDGPGGAWRVPDWQFTATGDLVPHLATVVAALPRGAAAVSARAFMTHPTTDLATDPGLPLRARSPVEWLTAGGEPGVVVRLAATLGEQI